MISPLATPTWLYREYRDTANDVTENFTPSNSTTHYLQCIAAASGEIDSRAFLQSQELAHVSVSDADCGRDDFTITPGPGGWHVISDYITNTGVNKLWVCDTYLLGNLPDCPDN